MKMISLRFELKQFLHLTEAKMLENERLWAQEHIDQLRKIDYLGITRKIALGNYDGRT